MKNIDNIKTNILYDPFDETILKDQLSYIEDVNTYNNLKEDINNLNLKEEMIKKMFLKVGNSPYIQAPFHANFGGKHVILGNNFYANFNLTLVDDGLITIGDNVLIGPNVTIITATHPISKKLRNKGLQYNKNVVIGNDCFIGAGSIILPGVNIGNNVIIGAGSVVTKDIKDNLIVAGNPAKIIRKITKDDDYIFDHDKIVDKKWLNEK